MQIALTDKNLNAQAILAHEHKAKYCLKKTHTAPTG
jgi:hypothetical protein